MAGVTDRLKRRVRMQVRATPENGPGTGTAVVSTLGLEYEIGWGWTEMIQSGCFDISMAAHPTIPIFYNHDWYGAPIGTGKPREEDGKLIVDFGLYLNDGDPLVARVYHAMVDKALEEWSIGFWAEKIEWDDDKGDCDIITQGDLAEASSCVRGANPETGTLELANRRGWVMGDDAARKREVSCLRSRSFNVPDLSGLRDRKATPTHSTATDDGAWDGPAAEKALDTPLTISVGNKMYAWRDPDKDETTKAAWKFPHHEVTDGSPGKANVKACQSVISILNGGMGGADIPEADVQGVYNHAAKHLKDAGVEPAELKSRSDPALAALVESFKEGGLSLNAVIRAFSAVIGRAADEDEPTAGDLAQSIDALVDQVVVLLEADPPDTKGALDVLQGADSTCDQLLELLGVPDDDDIADSERSRRERADNESDVCPAEPGCDHPASVHEDTDEGDNMGPCTTPGCDCPGVLVGGEDPGEDESAKADSVAAQIRLMGTPHGRKLLLSQSGAA
jgi:HK97 family phage prohead protease